MGHAIDERPFPRGVLIAAACLVSFTIVVAATARITGAGASHAAPAEVVQDMLLKFTLEKDGSVRARDAATNKEIAHLPQHNFGFIGVVLQGVNRERMRAKVSFDEPLRLTSHADGQLRIEDPSTGQTVPLSAFGYDNQRAFARLLEKGSMTP